MTCTFCGKLMDGVAGCLGWVAYSDGRVMPRLVNADAEYGNPCGSCRAPMLTPHHAGCSVERCAHCAARGQVALDGKLLQAISCGCEWRPVDAP